MTNSQIIEQLKTLIKSKVDQNKGINSLEFLARIKGDCLNLLKMIFPDVSEKDSQTVDSLYDTARNEYLSVNPIDINPSSTLRRKDLKIWLTDERKEHLAKDYIERYLRYLRKSGRAEKVIDEIAKSSEKILGNLGDPKSDS